MNPQTRRLLSLTAAVLIAVFGLSMAAAQTPTPTPTPTPSLRFEGANTDWTPQIETINGIDVALVPPGCFEMGSIDISDAPPHEQCIDEPYYIGVTEVTNAQYARCVDAGACTPPSNQTYFADQAYADHPVVYVDWFQARDYAAWWGGSLPTEREWEYAARGVDSWAYPWGDDWDGTRLNFCDRNCQFNWKDATASDGFARTSPIGSFLDGVSWVSALDMSGNVSEWTNSLWDEYPYPYDPDDGREADTGSRTDVVRVMRGSTWGSLRDDARAALRFTSRPIYRSNTGGFRVALGAPSP